MRFLIKALAVGVMLAGLASGFARAQTGPALSVKAPVMACEALAGADLGLITGTRAVVKSAQVEPGPAPYCHVQGVIAPAIRFELRLPQQGWTQRYLQTGCGGLCGAVQIHADHAETCQPLQTGALALGGTDMGHDGGMGEGAFGRDKQLRIDFAYRGVHATALAAQAVIRRYYGQAPRFSYFSGCSDGGREALMEAQRFPADFDGVAAGAPALNFLVQNTFFHAWMALSNTGADGKAILTADKLPILHAAALADCDAADGLKDGEIENPRVCRFDPGVTQCAAGAPDTFSCLTPAQVRVARAFYEGPTDAEGRHFTAGGPQVGSELAWRGVYVPQTPDQPTMSAGIALGVLKYLAFPQNPPTDFKLSDFKFTQAEFDRLQALHPLYDATDPNLAPFKARGGKLILWHGWSDPHISPLNLIAYYEAVRTTLGAGAAEAFSRLYLFPGLYHCAGGDGETQFDILTPLMAWVEAGQAPEQIIAGRTAVDPMAHMGPPPGAHGPGAHPPGGMRAMPVSFPALPVNRSRPVYPYPYTAAYVGAGSPDQAASFKQGAAPIAPNLQPWAGEGFFAPAQLPGATAP
ncbi:MAG: tannase/feruloyl esterase family alpha/beta hydrolase [Caulobacteraceae bacterium]